MNRIFYTDGSCNNNPGPGGWAAIEIEQIAYPILNNNHSIYALAKRFEISNYYYGGENKTTNNRMELIAILKVFEIAKQNPEDKFTIFSDSSYCIEMLTNWIFSWAGNNWKNQRGKEVENLDLVKQAYDYVTIPFFNCELIKIEGHSGYMGNELADALATKNKNKFNDIVKKHNIIIEGDLLNKEWC